MPKRHQTRRKTRKIKRTRKAGRQLALTKGGRRYRGGYNPVTDNGAYPAAAPAGYPTSTNWALPDPGHFETGINQINGPSSGGRRRRH